MSYLLDALRKAERERKLGRVPDLATDVGELPAATGVRPRLWLGGTIVTAVALNAAALAYLGWRWNAAPPPSVQPTATAAEPTASPVEPDAVGSPAGETATPVAAGGQPPGAAAVAAAPAATGPAEPVSKPADAPPLNALPPATRQAVPDLDVSGHLYSTVPGRSFVLVDGRRYHEGATLAGGGTVESIDAGGAVIDYRGRRFRLAAPR